MYPIVATASSVCSLQMGPIRKQAARRLTRTLKLQLMREWEGCISYMLPSPAGTANEMHTISSKEVHNCSLLPPFDVHRPHYSTYCLSGQSYNVSTFKAFGVLGGQSDSRLFQWCCASERSWRRPSLLGQCILLHRCSSSSSSRDIMRSYLWQSVANVTELISRRDEKCNLSECLCRRSNICLSSWEQRTKRKHQW